MKQEILNKIKELKEIIKEDKLNISDEAIFHEACSFIRGEYAGQKNTKSAEKKQEPPTEKQIWRLDKIAKDFKIKIPKDLTKQDASALIDKYSKEYL